jgi:hypothetical protein
MSAEDDDLDMEDEPQKGAVDVIKDVFGSSDEEVCVAGAAHRSLTNCFPLAFALYMYLRACS